jgi:hypothetical protein
MRKPVLHWEFVLAIALLLDAASPVLANDDMLVYTELLNNGWQDWGWVPHYATNNPSFNGANTMVFAASGPWQAWYLAHDPINAALYANLSLWLNGGSVGGQTVGVAAGGASWGATIYVTAPTNAWKQFTFSLASLGVANATNLQAIEIWNSGTLQSNFYVADISLAANPPPALVHVNINATSTVRTVDSRVFGVNTAAWDGNLDTTNTLNLLTNLDNQALRWPGGSWGDIYFMTNEEARGWGSINYPWTLVASAAFAESSEHGPSARGLAQPASRVGVPARMVAASGLVVVCSGRKARNRPATDLWPWRRRSRKTGQAAAGNGIQWCAPRVSNKVRA